MRNSFAHALIDNIPRAYLLNQPEYAEFKEIKLLCPNSMTKLESFFIPSLIPSNVVVTPVQSGYLYDVEKFIFPSFFQPAGACYFPSSYLKKLRAEFMPQRQRNKNKRIFISRLKCAEGKTKRHILNESELFEKLSNLGFERYVLEDMSLEAQVELFYDAETVVGADGAGMFWTLFSEKARVLVLFNRTLIPAYYYTIAKNLGHQYRHWCCSEKGKNKSYHYYNFRVDVPKVLELLSTFSEDFD
ncbi:MAG: glycosyltransferase family 61 protein [Xenococcaceae cyanobacterium MO_188.B29]|nr:glycosyltransferase family 61 protein [Xenococcaceae cyanobacterium MO_188.B29]